MGSNQQNIPIPLLNTFVETIKKIGVDKTQSILIQSCKYNSVETLSIIQIIQNAVCNEFNIPLKRLLEEKVKNSVRADATRVLVFLLYDLLKYTLKDIIENNIMNLKRTCYRNYIDYINDLDPKIKNDRDLLQHIDNIKTEIELELKNKNLTINTNKHGTSK